MHHGRNRWGIKDVQWNPISGGYPWAQILAFKDDRHKWLLYNYSSYQLPKTSYMSCLLLDKQQLVRYPRSLENKCWGFTFVLTVVIRGWGWGREEENKTKLFCFGTKVMSHQLGIACICIRRPRGSRKLELWSQGHFAGMLQEMRQTMHYLVMTTNKRI